MNMTAPPFQMPIFTSAPYFSSSSTVTDSTTSWPSMTSHKYNAPRQRKSSSKASSPAANKRNGSELLFITAFKPSDFKDRQVMTEVRKQAMSSYLQHQKPKKSSRAGSDDTSSSSSGSRASVGSDHQDPVDDVTSKSDALAMFYGESRRASRRPSSPARSPTSTGSDRQVVRPATFMSHIPPTIILPQANIVQPMRTGIQLPYMQYAVGPFQSIGRPLDPFRTIFQASHPRVSVEELKFHCSRFFGTRAMGRYWIPSLVSSPHAFLSTLCIASTHHDAIKSRQIESLETTALRQEVIHLIQQNILNPEARVDDFNVIALTQLIASEIISSDDTILGYHESGIEAMVTMRGGLDKLGVDGRLASTLSWVSLESAVLRESKPRAIYSNYSVTSTKKTYPATATIPESPVFCPRGDFQTVERSSRCAPRTLKLLKDIRMMLDLFLHETKHSRKNETSLQTLYESITSSQRYPSAAELQKHNVMTPSDWTYEAIRVAAVIQATAIIKRIPLSAALKYVAQHENHSSLYASTNASSSNESLISPTTLRHDSPFTSFSTSPAYATSPAYPQSQNAYNFAAPRPSISSSISDLQFFPPPTMATPSGPTTLLTNLKTSIENSDMSDVWTDMAGVLLWIGLVIGAASHRSDKVHKKWFRALAVRCSIVLCFDHPDPMLATLGRMGECVELLGAKREDGRISKKRKMGK